MATSTGPCDSGASKAGRDRSSSERRRADALLQDTLDEIASVFRIEEAFPFAAQEEHYEPRRSLWTRVKDWFYGRSARRGAGGLEACVHQPRKYTEGMGVAGAEPGRRQTDDRPAPPAPPAEPGQADRPESWISGSYPR